MKAVIIMNKSEYRIIKKHAIPLFRENYKISIFNHDDVVGVKYAEDFEIDIPYGMYIKAYIDDKGNIVKHTLYDIGILNKQVVRPCKEVNANYTYMIPNTIMLCTDKTIN